jgi:hypothetical protein
MLAVSAASRSIAARGVSRGREQAAPAAHRVARQAGLCERRNLGAPAKRCAPGDADRAQLSGAHMLQHGGSVANMSCTCPPEEVAHAGPPPLYGTCWSSTPAIALKSSPQRCVDVPVPEDA